MNYFNKYKKYKLKYLDLKWENLVDYKGSSDPKQKISLQSSRSPIECELINLVIADKGEDIFYLKRCKCDYTSYHTTWIPGCKVCKINKQILLKKNKSFKFKNSLGGYLEGLFNDSKLKYIGSFDSPSTKLIICNEPYDVPSTKNIDKYLENRDKYLCIPIKAYPGKWDVYFLDWFHHWNQRTFYNDWEGAALILLDNQSFDILDQLEWYKDIVYAHSAFGVFSYYQFADKSPLDPKKMVAKVDSHKKCAHLDDYLSCIHNSYQLNNFRDKYIFIQSGVTFIACEARVRPYIYGVDQTGIAVAILLHSLF